ncbi:hypothetical protein Syun_011048 [Stephania yunnanensis]|uniref:Uncharacterized protein n=1 Tax=Stephania yunnanensis TaxID=152371 RepID=A0AAP0JY38_9MAGN
MPKESSARSLSSNNTRSSPYPSCSNRASGAIPRKDLGAEKDRKEWEEVRCPVCMEHPHNAVLLKCSSYDKGCRPYICNTSCRHSNCLDQFCKAFANPKTDEIEGASSSNHRNTGDYGSGRKHPKFICPLCRGDVSDWIVVEAARNFMNSKTRSCASETCDYSGMYADLRRHARLAHPFVRPFEIDPERERRWTRMEQERDFGDL